MGKKKLHLLDERPPSPSILQYRVIISAKKPFLMMILKNNTLLTPGFYH